MKILHKLIKSQLPALFGLAVCFFWFSSACAFRAGAQDIQEEVEAAPDTVTIKIIGDVMLHQGQIDCAKNHAKGKGFDFHPYLDSIKTDLSEATIAIANMEFSLGGAPYTGYPAFSAPDSYASYVRDLGVDVFLTANNHILDRGVKGFKRTMEVYDTLAGVTYTRVNPTYVEAQGLRFAIINVTYGTNGGQSAKPGDEYYVPFMTDKKFILDAVAQARRDSADFIIALPHWGEEYVLKHNASQESFARALADAGVDVIVGAHPHCVQDRGFVKGTTDGVTRDVPVYYSVGNAVSNMSATNTQLELMVTLTFAPEEILAPDGTKTFKYKMLPPTHDWLWCSRPGYLNDWYCTIKVEDFIGRRSQWKNPYDYDKMMATYKRIATNY